MPNNLIAAPRLLTFAFYVFFIFSIQTPAQKFHPFSTAMPTKTGFANPVLKISAAGCAADNLRAERFASDATFDERAKLCRTLDKVTSKLNQTAWSPVLAAELQSIWQVFSTEPVILRSMPPGIHSQILATAEPFPAGGNGNRFTAVVSLRSEKSADATFFQILFHELRHVFDFYETWRDKTALDSLEIERRAYLLMGKLTRETPEKESFSGVPKFWKESWRNNSDAEISAKRLSAIEKYLRGKKLYRDLARDPKRRTLDFSYLKIAAKYGSGQPIIGYDKKAGVRLPLHKTLPQTVALLSQNIRETNFNLEKPMNPRDEKEILRVALSNEKKLYYGMSNFIYDQKVTFQCLKEGKPSASFNESGTMARTDDGNVLSNLTVAPADLSCVLNYGDLKTDFTNTFWASPALEKMPMYFSGFHEVDGVTLAHYTVTQPDERLFAELANEYPYIRPFRVVVGTIYVSPDDGQIVRFAGTSFPEEKVTGNYAQRARCTYWVKAVRQKINIENGLWVTVHVGTVAVAIVQGKVRPFNYTVKFENYRQGTTDVKILDDEIVAGNTSK